MCSHRGHYDPKFAFVTRKDFALRAFRDDGDDIDNDNNDNNGGDEDDRYRTGTSIAYRYRYCCFENLRALTFAWCSIAPIFLHADFGLVFDRRKFSVDIA